MASYNTREDILRIQLLMLEAFTNEPRWLGTTDLRQILDLRGTSAGMRTIQQYCKAFVNMGLITINPSDTKPWTMNVRYKKSGKIAVSYNI